MNFYALGALREPGVLGGTESKRPQLTKSGVADGLRTSGGVATADALAPIDAADVGMLQSVITSTGWCSINRSMAGHASPTERWSARLNAIGQRACDIPGNYPP